jgi:hypothetical protein
MAWVIDRLGRSLFRGTGITAHMENGGTLEKVRQMVARVSTRATQLYDRRQDRVTLDEVEEIAQSAHTSRRSNRSHSANRRARGYRIRNDSADSRKFRTGSQFEVSGSGKLMRTIMADLASPSSSATSFGTASSQVWLRPRARRVVLENWWAMLEVKAESLLRQDAHFPAAEAIERLLCLARTALLC